METFKQQNYLEQEQAMLDHIRDDFKTHASIKLTILPFEKLIHSAEILYQNGNEETAESIKRGVHDLIIELTTLLSNLKDKQEKLRLSDELLIVKKVTELERQVKQAA